MDFTNPSPWTTPADPTNRVEPDPEYPEYDAAPARSDAPTTVVGYRYYQAPVAWTLFVLAVSALALCFVQFVKVGGFIGTATGVLLLLGAGFPAALLLFRYAPDDDGEDVDEI